MSYNYFLFEKKKETISPSSCITKASETSQNVYFSLTDIVTMTKTRLKDNLSFAEPENVTKKLSDKGLFRNHLLKMERELQNPHANSPLSCSQEFALYF